jgi:two-component system, chemotaxis family, chemotaxis protein CheY
VSEAAGDGDKSGGKEVKHPAGPSLHQLKFLVVEDDVHMREFVVAMLAELGVNAVGEAADGGAALAFMAEYAPDIVITDLYMEPMDGLELVRKVRAGQGGINRYTPFILLTVHTEHSRVDEARDAGVNEFVAKPVSLRALYSRICALIEDPRPFVHTDTYFGPDRRRKQVVFSHPNRRKIMPWLTKVEAPGAGGATSAHKGRSEL